MDKYQSYKSSGVEWIGEIPSFWRISKFKYVSKLFTGNSLNDEQKLLYESDNENDIPYVSSKDIDLNTQTVNYFNGLRIPKDNNPLKVSPKDSFLLCVEGGSSGRKMVYLDREVCFVNKLCSFQSIENTRFQYYFIQSSNFQDKFKLSLSGLIGGVSISTLRDFELVLPPLSEQHQIVQFLDSKTELIDKLISTKERKISLLKEQRTSLINHIITKGLNPKVQMKDSGVEWIGEIPEHWNIGKLKHICKENLNSLSNNTNPEYQLNYIEISDVNSDGVIENSTHYFFSESPSRCRRIVNRGDVILSTVRTYLRSIGIIEDEVSDLICSTGFSVLTPNRGVFPRHLFYMVRTEWFISMVISKSEGVSYPSIQSEKLMSNLILIVPENEQHQIVNYLDSKTKEIDDLIQLEQKKINLLKEYRQSLISEVVTGKLNVSTKN